VAHLSIIAVDILNSLYLVLTVATVVEHKHIRYILKIKYIKCKYAYHILARLILSL